MHAADGRAAISEGEQHFRQMVDAIPATLFVATPDGEMEYATRPPVDFLGRGVETLRDGGWVSMIHPDDAAALVGRWRVLVATGGSLDAEFRARRVDGVFRETGRAKSSAGTG